MNRQIFSLRRSKTIGVCSIILGALFIAGTTVTTHAQGTTTATPNTSTSNSTDVSFTPNYVGTVTMAGQLNEHNMTTGIDINKNFTTADDVLGVGTEHEGLYNHLRTNFLGWSTQPLDANEQIPENAKIFLATDKISTVYPDGIPANAKLYAIYQKIDIDTRNFATLINWLGGDITGDIARDVNENNKIILNKNIDDEATLPNTTRLPEKSNENTKQIIDRYEKTDDTTTVNEIVLKSEFEMNKKVALLMYHNPTGGYGDGESNRIFTRNYAEKFSTGEFTTESTDNIDYTYVDLKINLDDKIVLPEKIYLSFDSYAWRPLFVLDSQGNALDIFDPTSNTNLGNDKFAFNSLVNNTSSEIIFGVNNPNQLRDLTVRVILRSDDTITFADGTKNKERIVNNIVTQNGESKADTILKNMTFHILSTSELTNIGISNPEKHVIRISDPVAQTLAVSNGANRTLINGTIKGRVRASVGDIQSFELHAFLPIAAVTVANPISIGYSANVAVHYVLSTNAELLKTAYVTIANDNTYDTRSLKQDSITKDGVKYHLIRVEGTETGSITQPLTTVTYVYTPEETNTTNTYGTVLVSFVDKNDNEIAPKLILAENLTVSTTTTTTVNGKVINQNTILSNERYDSSGTQPQEIVYNNKKYRLIGLKDTSAPEQGTVAQGITQVSYVYEEVLESNTPYKSKNLNGPKNAPKLPETGASHSTQLSVIGAALITLGTSVYYKRKKDN